MQLTEALKAWLVEHAGVKQDASDDEFRRAAAEAMTKATGEAGYLSTEQLVELQKDKDATKASGIEVLLGKMVETQEAIVSKLNSNETPPKAADDSATAVADPPPQKEEPAASDKKVDGEGDEVEPTALKNRFATEATKNLDAIFSRMGDDGASLGDGQPRHKGAWEQYDTSKTAAVFPEFTKSGQRHSLAGQPATIEGRLLDHPSQQERAAAGAWWKYLINRDAGFKGVPRQLRFTQHDKELVQWMLHEREWGGCIGGIGGEDSGVNEVKMRKLRDFEIKEILDDGVSGGIEIAPIFFDDQVILTPLLFGELFPLVELVNITRGRRIEGGRMGNVTLAWGGGDNVATGLFNTNGFITAFDNNIHVIDGAIEIGLDFLGDSPIAVDDIIRGQYGNRLLEELDTVIFRGNGAIQPEGVMIAAGAAVIAAGGVAPTTGIYEQLFFGVAKQFKNADAGRIVFAANETTYRRARAIPVGAADARRIFGQTYGDYRLMDHPYKIVAAALNAEVAYVNLARYRMYRRLGFTFRSTMEGRDLMRRNMWLGLARARFGGALTLGGYCARSITMQP